MSTTSATQDTVWFGGGAIYGLNVGGAQPSILVPGNFATIQEASVDFSVTLKELRGAYEDPESIASASRKVTGKITTGRVSLQNLNQFVFGETLATGYDQTVNFEQQTAASSVVVDEFVSDNFVQDLGVWYKTGGPEGSHIQLVPVPLTSPPTSLTQGQYSVNSATGTYYFATADFGQGVQISYQVAQTTGHTLLVNNKIMGFNTRPIFSAYFDNPAEGDNSLVLFACRASKITLPIKREDYVIMEIDFQAYSNESGQMMQWMESV